MGRLGKADRRKGLRQMLKPEYFDNKADRMIEIYQQLEDFILKDIAGRLMKSQSVSGTADRMIWKLRQMGESQAAIMTQLTKVTGLSRRELKALLQDAVMTSWDDDLSAFNRLGIDILNPLENAAVASVMNAEYVKAQGELENLTRSTMSQATQDLMNMLNEAEIRVVSGVQSYSSAVCDILDRYAGRGVTIAYPTGAKRTLEAAVRMCVVTSMNQTSAQITNQYIVEGNVEYVLVSAHLGARIQQPGQPYLAGHDNWQGKAYKIRGSEPGFPNLLEMTGYDIGEDGEGIVVNPLGLHGYNCRHSHQPWDKGLKNPYVDENGKPIIDTAESKELYKKQQKQRSMERAIRKTKRELLVKQTEIEGVAETDVKEILQKKYDEMAFDLRQQNADYTEYCKKNSLQKQEDRLKVAGFKRAQSAQASGRARAYEHWSKQQADLTQKNSSKGAIKGALNDDNDPLGEKRDSHAQRYYAEIRNRNKNSVVKALSRNSNTSEKTAQTVYEHVFENAHLFKSGEIKRFDPDYQMAQSFQRLLQGNNIQSHDITLLRHERLEYLLMKRYNMVYEDAHDMAERKYNYAAELKKFLRRE